MKLFEILNKITAYHGSDHKISEFTGISYFTPQEDVAKGYARGKAKINKKKVGYLHKVTFTLKKIKKFSTMQQIGALTKKNIEDLKAEGYDGAYYDGSGNYPVAEYIPFNLDIVKLVSVEEVKL